jgi:hypothetical protein
MMIPDSWPMVYQDVFSSGTLAVGKEINLPD